MERFTLRVARVAWIKTKTAPLITRPIDSSAAAWPARNWQNLTSRCP